MKQFNNINLKEARRIKEKFALANTEFAYNSENYEISQGENKIIINQREVSELVEKCYLQIFQLIKKEIVALGFKLCSSGIVPVFVRLQTQFAIQS